MSEERFSEVVKAFFLYNNTHHPEEQRWVLRKDILAYFDLTDNMVDKQMKRGKHLTLTEFVKLMLWMLNSYKTLQERLDFLLDMFSLLFCGTYENEHYACHPFPEEGVREAMEELANKATRERLEFVKRQLELGNVEGAKHYIDGVLEDLK